MPHNEKTNPNAAHDPGLVTLFGRSRKSYEVNVSDLLADLDAAAARTRQAREGSKGKAATAGSKGRSAGSLKHTTRKASG